MKKIIIAIDGVSASGKSTIARGAAKNLDYSHIDTGAMYRAVALCFLEKHVDITQKHNINEALHSVSIAFSYNSKTKREEVTLNGKFVESQIRVPEVDEYASKISIFPCVRKLLLQKQRQMGKSGGIVMDGRDIGTVTFPKAELKIFTTASINVRAKRRYLELIKNQKKITLEAIKSNLLERDKADSSRKISPLHKTTNAILLDTSHLNLDESVEKVMNLVTKII